MARRVAVCVIALVVGTGRVSIAQKVVSPEELDQAMKTIGTAIEGRHTGYRVELLCRGS